MSANHSQKRRRDSTASIVTEDASEAVPAAPTHSQSQSAGKRHKGNLAGAASSASVSSAQSSLAADASGADSAAGADSDGPLAAVAERVHAANQDKAVTKPSAKRAVFLAKRPGMTPEEILGEQFVFVVDFTTG